MGVLEGKVAIVSGGGSGIGRAIVERFAAEGASVFVGELNAERLGDVIASVRAAGGTADGLATDISQKEQAERLVDAAVQAFGSLHVVVNNAGIMDNNAGVAALLDDDWNRVLGVNLYGTMYVTRRAVQVMLERGGGTIVNIASVAGLVGGVAGVAYTVSKHGIIGLTKNTAWVYGPKGIRCNAICPGAVRTNIQQSMIPERIDPYGTERAQLTYQLIPAQMEPDDIARVALFLASDDSKHINGEALVVDAGWLAGM